MALDISSLKLTFDTDDNRLNTSIAGVRLPNGRLVNFYEKEFTSGRTSEYYDPAHTDVSNVTIVGTFTIRIQAGTGLLNGIPITWSLTDLVLAPNTYQLIYVTEAGVVGNTTDFPMSFTKNVVWLSLAYVGNSAITKLEQIEKWARYIFSRRQIQVSGEWVWDDYEFLLNTGENPKCFYDSSVALIYLSYRKDSASYIRTFDITNELTWSYITNINISSGPTINLNRDPENQVLFQTASGIVSTANIESDDFLPMGNTGLGFIDETKDNVHFDPYIFLPFIGTTYQFYVRFPITYEIGRIENNNFILEDSVDFDSLQYIGMDRWHKWTGTSGTKYLRVKGYVQLIRGIFTTPVSKYKTIEVYTTFEKTEIDSTNTNISTNARDEVIRLSSAAGTDAEINKVNEYIQSRDYEQDSHSFTTASGIFSKIDKINEYDQTRDYEQDSHSFSSSCGIYAKVSISG